MKKIDVVRAWKSAAYRDALTAEERALVPAHPAGLVELSDSELREAAGMNAALANTTAMKCTELTLIKHRCCP